MKRLCALALLAILCLSAQAISRPTTPAGAPKDGGQYILVNAYTTDGYMAMTSWDSALYFLGESDSDYENNAFTAILNDDGTWSFVYYGTEESVTENEDGTSDTTTVDVTYYIGLGSTSNVYPNLTDQTKWTVTEGDIDGFYYVISGEGNWSHTIGYPMHLNSGAQYLVVSVEEDSWYPDYCGGTIYTEEGNDYDGGQYEVGEDGRALFADSTSWNWAFIAVSDVPEWMALYEVYGEFVAYEDYLAVDGYETGFQASYDAALAIYEGSDFNWEDDCETVIAILSAKVEYYELIEDAKRYDEPDAALSTAISTAETSFQTITSTSEVESAIETLQAAIDAYLLGTGDVSGLGTNLSFEDLTAQDGATTSGVAAPPTGWDVYIDGTQVTTAEEVTAAGITGWHGVNDDVVNQTGSYAFGIWNSGIPAYQISQTIEGLDNGTYVVTAWLMVGANTYGSRRTTQRLFGNYNATYFGSAEEYDEDELDVPEVHAYAGLEEPTTDTQLQELSVRAYVYDGTLTFGIKTDANITAALRTSSNSAGGDGWFKCDYFTIQQEGYVAADAVEVANYFIDQFTTYRYEEMYSGLKDQLEEVLSTYTSVDESTAEDDVNAIIIALASLLSEVAGSVEAYAELWQAIDDGYTAADEYSFYSGFDDYVALIEEAEAGWEDGLYTTEEVAEVIASISEALVELQKSGIAVGEYLSIVQNASFEDLSNQSNTESSGAVAPPAGWDLYINGELCTSVADYTSAGASLGWCAINTGDELSDAVDDDGNEITVQYTDGTHLWGIWAASIPEVQLSQTFTGVPSGTYILSADVMVEYNWAGDCTTSQRIFGNDYMQLWGEESYYEDDLLPDDVAEAKAYADGEHLTYAGYICSEDYEQVCHSLRAMSITFGVDESGEMTIGFRTDGNRPNSSVSDVSGQGWFKVDNFQLYFESEDIPTAITSTAISNNASQLTAQQYFTLDGAQVNAPQKGVTLVKNIFSDGSVRTTKIYR